MGPTKEAVEEVAKRTGLKVSTVTDLLQAGWVYQETLKAPRTWLGPEVNFRR